MTDIHPPADRSPLQQRVLRQRAVLFNLLLDPLQRAAHRCAPVWRDKALLDATLLMCLTEVPYCKFLYALDPQARQISANASYDGLIGKDYGRDRADRPYIRETAADRDLTLSEAYLSLRANRPSVTAIQKVRRNGELIGLLGADFDLRNLPITQELYAEPGRWRQIKGDPAIRGKVFEQTRIQSRLDAHIDEVIPVMEELMVHNGAFHLKLHFSSSRATTWFIDDPYRYQIIEADDLLDPDICLVYPHRPYAPDALIREAQIRPVLETFKRLRLNDDTIYLRSGSLNIFNGIIGLNFSCDGSHYIPYDQFLSQDSEFWDGMV